MKEFVTENGLRIRQVDTDAKKHAIVVTRKNALVVIEMRKNAKNMSNFLERRIVNTIGLHRTLENMDVGNLVASVANGPMDEYLNL